MGCSVVLKNIDTNCETIVGGIDKVYIANFDTIKKVESDAQTGKITAITMVNPSKDYFYTFDFRKQSSGFTSEMQVDAVANTRFFNSSVSLRFSKMEAAKRVAFQALCTGEFACIIKDNNNLYWYLGKDRTVTASAAGANAGVNLTDANEYTITLNAMDNEMPYEVDSTIIDALITDPAAAAATV